MSEVKRYFEVKSRFNTSVLFSLETDSMKLCVEAAVKSGADLSNANLYGADLYGADLSRANLSRANLSNAYLYGADLSRADLSRANLSNAYLYGADLSNAYLYGADLSNTYLYGADLYGADLYGVNLSGADDKKLTLVGERPWMQLGPLGSRNATLLAFLTDAGVYVRAGCFWDTLEAFKAAVAKNHGDNKHGQEYGLAVQMIELHAKLWTPGVAALARGEEHCTECGELPSRGHNAECKLR